MLPTGVPAKTAIKSPSVEQTTEITADEIDELQEIAKNLTEEVSKSDIIKKDKGK